VGARPGAAGAPSMSNPGQGRVGMGAVSAGTGPGAVINGPRGPMPMGAPGAPTTSMGLTVGGAPVVGSSGAAPGRPTAPGMTGYNPSGEIMAMLGKGPAGSMAAKMPGGALGSSEEHDLPNFGADDFPALGGGMGSVPVYRSGSSDTLGAAMGGMQGGMSGIAAAKLPQDFQMASEDFPALPGLGMREGENGMDQMDMNIPQQAQPGGHLMQGAQASQGGHGQIMNLSGLGGGAVRRPGFEGTTQAPKPGSMHPDHFGLLGLLSVIQMTNPDLNTLALGTDLTTLGLNLNSTESLYSTFASPWADGPSRREPEFSLPMCYYMQPPTLKSGHIQKFQLETLFYIFYMLPKDTLQAVAASELYSRDWKFHRDLKMWFHKQPSLGAMGADGKTGYNRPNTYIYFDVNVWERRTYYDANKNLEQGFLSEEEVRLK